MSKKMKCWINTTVEVDISEYVSVDIDELEDKDLIEICRQKGLMTEPKADNLLDQMKLEIFLKKIDKYTLEELENK
jgi:hypothetical protein